MSFQSFGLSNPILAALVQKQISTPYLIQQESIPHLLKGEDLLGIAPTGSGKTLAFALPIIEKLLKAPVNRNRLIDALILVPTRELAIQVEAEFKTVTDFIPDLKTKAVYGGVSINPQMKGLLGTQILIATPGRLLDLISKNALQLSAVKYLVLDEADQVLSLGFKDEVDKILALIPTKRQTMLFSATTGENVQDLIKKALKRPQLLELSREVPTPELIDQKAYKVSEEEKGPFLRQLLKENEWSQVLVFVSSVRMADNIVQKLKKNGFDAMPLHSQKSQGARTDALTKFKAGKLKVLVATDLAARGIDIKLLPCVINYELPRSPQDYIHRIGRTGRAEKEGLAISFVTEADLHHFGVIQKKMKKQVEIIGM